MMCSLGSYDPKEGERLLMDHRKFLWHQWLYRKKVANSMPKAKELVDKCVVVEVSCGTSHLLLVERAKLQVAMVVSL
jgi:hypothetical protein